MSKVLIQLKNTKLPVFCTEKDTQTPAKNQHFLCLEFQFVCSPFGQNYELLSLKPSKWACVNSLNFNLVQDCWTKSISQLQISKGISYTKGNKSMHDFEY